MYCDVGFYRCVSDKTYYVLYVAIERKLYYFILIASSLYIVKFISGF